MGYTHYFTPKGHNPKQWETFTETCKALHKALPKDIKICGGGGTGQPVIGGFKGKPSKQYREWFPDPTNSIWFNGKESEGLDYETLLIEQNKMDWAFCKTARKPYDLFVCACLLAAKEYLDFEVTSDGGLEDWEEAIKFYLNTIYDETPDLEGLKIIVPDVFHEELENYSFN